MPAKGLFFVFSDPTSKTNTYPGGRFLKTEPVTNGTVVLDFNRAYNPPCAVTAYATCPLAPKENRLSVRDSSRRRVRPQTRPPLEDPLTTKDTKVHERNSLVNLRVLCGLRL